MSPVKILFIGLVILLSISISCNKDKQHDSDAVKATLNDFTGLDGCNWVVKLEDSEVLEPINLSDFNFGLKDGKKIWIKYKPAENMASFCMVGPIVEIEGIWER